MKTPIVHDFSPRYRGANPPVTLDRIDGTILKVIRDNNQITNLELSARIGL